MSRDFEFIKQQAADIGLTCNTSKCEICYLTAANDYNNDSTTTFEGTITVQRDNLTLLGAALGAQSLESLLNHHTEQLKRFQNNLMQLHSHDAFYLLKHCLSIPTLLFSLRTSPCFASVHTLHTLDRCLQDTVSAVLNVSIGKYEWVQASLPAKMGGLGIPSPCVIAGAAFISSFKSSQTLASTLAGPTASPPCVQEALDEWQSVSDSPIPSSSRQAAWTTPREAKA